MPQYIIVTRKVDIDDRQSYIKKCSLWKIEFSLKLNKKPYKQKWVGMFFEDSLRKSSWNL